jgi:putative nucleotidyltransferase with HDIG domain
MSTLPLTERELSRTLTLASQLEELSEATTAVFTLNEENHSIHVSATDPVNRELAKVVFAELLRNSRNRGPLSQLIDKQARQLDQSIRRAGMTAAREAGCPDLPGEVVATLGRLAYRYSYGQNQLTHAVETARLAAMLATELGADVQIARAGGLLHDLGRRSTATWRARTLRSARLAVDAGIEAPIAHCIEAHHEEIEPNTTEALITIVADAASGGRPGARRESLENYLAKLQALEAVAYMFPGVEKCYAIQAGRELRVMVDRSWSATWGRADRDGDQPADTGDAGVPGADQGDGDPRAADGGADAGEGLAGGRPLSEAVRLKPDPRCVWESRLGCPHPGNLRRNTVDERLARYS